MLKKIGPVICGVALAGVLVTSIHYFHPELLTHSIDWIAQKSSQILEDSQKETSQEKTSPLKESAKCERKEKNSGNGITTCCLKGKAYQKPEESEIKTPDQVAGKSGVTPIKENREHIKEKEAETLFRCVGRGESGEGLTFDTEIYPYYGMLSESLQKVYRQVYANAVTLNARFIPIETVAEEQIKYVFEAIYNDHPELFWLDTTYSCKYRSNGICVEIGLSFNKTANQMEASRTAFENHAALILDAARNLPSDYQKEKYVHDQLLANVTYQSDAAMNQSAYSALVNGESVCAGYARAFQYLMQQLNIPCYYCSGYSGQDHAWNMIRLGQDYYNVDVTWDDTEPNTYDFFNKTDADLASTHVRNEMSIYLPACDGTAYQGLEKNVFPNDKRKCLEDTGIHQEAVLTGLRAYYENCSENLKHAYIGENKFQNVVEGEAVLGEIFDAYHQKNYLEGYANRIMKEIGASSCEINIKTEELQGERFLLTHSIVFK